MRLKKRLLIALLPLALFFVALLPSTAWAQTGHYVFDTNDTLSEEEFTELETKGAQYADKYHVGVYLLFTSDMGADEDSKSGRNEFGRDYYLQHNLGEGPGKDGIILVVATQSRKYVTVKHFDDKANDPFSKDYVSDMESEVKSELKHNNWFDGASVYYQRTEDALDYFAKNGKQWSEPHVIGTVIKIAATVLVPLFIAHGIVSREKQAMLTARMQTEAANYLDPNSFNIRVSTDTFVDRHLSVTPIPKHEDHDSGGGWSDMGGGFSGSGGGDF